MRGVNTSGGMHLEKDSELFHRAWQLNKNPPSFSSHIIRIERNESWCVTEYGKDFQNFRSNVLSNRPLFVDKNLYQFITAITIIYSERRDTRVWICNDKRPYFCLVNSFPKELRGNSDRGRREIDVYFQLVYDNTQYRGRPIDHRGAGYRAGKAVECRWRWLILMMRERREGEGGGSGWRRDRKRYSERSGAGTVGVYAGVNNRRTCPFNLLRRPFHR